MIIRIFAGLIAAVLVTAAIFFGNHFTVFATILTCTLLSCYEYISLIDSESSTVSKSRFILLCVVAVLLLSKGLLWGLAAFVFAITLTLLFHLLKSVVQNSTIAPAIQLQNANSEVLGLVYVLFLTGFLGPIFLIGKECLFYLLFIVFMSDTLAFFCGSLFGKHKLAEHISPKKTIEGSIGSIIGCGLISFAWGQFPVSGMLQTFSPWILVLLGATLSVLGQLGDLFESLLKRSHSKKDSGKFLPGHGGMLDRIDSLCFAAPWFYFYLVVTKYSWM